jgi:hypothetical protein
MSPHHFQDEEAIDLAFRCVFGLRASSVCDMGREVADVE